MALLIYVFSMSNLNDIDKQYFVMNFINNTIISYSNSIALSTL